MIPYEFKDKSLLQQALTHSSYSANENYERLEFLGDAILGLCISKMLMVKGVSPGSMSRYRANLVKESTLANVARILSLPSDIRIGKGVDIQNDSILADVLEAIFGAIFEDSGFDTVYGIVSGIFTTLIDQVERMNDDYKTQLQELTQEKGFLPQYILEYVTGTQHQPVFHFSVARPNGVRLGNGSGHSKKSACQAAAKMAIEVVKSW